VCLVGLPTCFFARASSNARGGAAAGVSRPPHVHDVGRKGEWEEEDNNWSPQGES